MNKALTPSKTPRFFKILHVVGIIGITLLLVNFFYQLHARKTAKVQPGLNAACDLQATSCIKNLPNGAILELNLEPRPIKADTPLNIKVKLTHIAPQQVAAMLFSIPATQTVTNPVILTLQDDGKYTAEVFINKTETLHQTWVLMIMLRVDENQISVPFKFSV